jgi:hypothetical protein
MINNPIGLLWFSLSPCPAFPATCGRAKTSTLFRDGRSDVIVRFTLSFKFELNAGLAALCAFASLH